MFTGIVAHVGQIVDVQSLQDGARIVVDCAGWDIADVGMGDSVMHNGCCLTVVSIDTGKLTYELSAHSLKLTTSLQAKGPVNLEKSLRLADRLGGHLVTGHVDCVGTVTQWNNIAESWFLEVEVPAEHSRFIAKKGSVCVHGVSLTVNEVQGHRFQCNIIPHTYAVTTLNTLHAGAKVNIEVDLMARYVERMVSITQ